MITQLEHHGIKGMHWGIRRYQPYPKGHKGGQEIGEASRKVNNSSNSEKSLTKEESLRRYEERKQKALKSGSAKDILEFKGDLTNQEMEISIKRMDLERKLISYATPKVKSNKEKMDELMGNVKTVTEWTKIGTETYNTFAKIYNATDKGQQKPLRLVKGDSGNNKRKRN